METASTRLVGRLAPTPSGYLHAGNVFNFILTWLMVRSANGRLILRIDDLDQDRVRPEYLQSIFDTLDWLEIDYDDGPRSVAEVREHFSQVHRHSSYQQAAERLATLPQTFYCTCSRKQSSGEEPCLGKQHPFIPNSTALKADTRGVLIHLPGTSAPGRLHEILPFFVIWRKDNLPAYQLASVIDDVAMGVNLIVRGEDLLSSSYAQLYLADLLGLEHFKKAQFVHHPLLNGKDGQKLSKSTKAAPLRQTFDTPAAVYRAAGAWLGLDLRHLQLIGMLEAWKNKLVAGE